MDPSQPPQPGPLLPRTGPPRLVGRREFLVVAGGAAASITFAPARAWARRVRVRPVALQPWSLPAEAPSNGLDLARALIGAGVLAPSEWNSQPWRFEVDDQTIRLLADTQRALPMTDPDRRGMMMSLGAALENLLVAARAYGLQPTVLYKPAGSARGVVAEVALSPGTARRDRRFFDALTARRTNRRNFDGRGLLPQHRAALGAQVADGPSLYWIDDRDGLHAIADMVHDAEHAQVSDRRIQAEQRAWMRPGEKEARQRGDGVPVDALGMSGPANWFAGKYFDPSSWFLRFGAGSMAKRARECVRTSGAVALLALPGHDETAWLQAGQVFERIALCATQLGLAHQAMTAPIRVERFRGPLLRRFGGSGAEPLVLMRFGHAKTVDPTPRRGVGMVASFRNT